jgi:hypothetical protein
MKKIADNSTAQSAAEADSPSNGRKSQYLRFEKQTIRTLTGAELKLVGGGCKPISECFTSTISF